MVTELSSNNSMKGKYIRTEEIKKKNREANLGRKHTKEEIEKMKLEIPWNKGLTKEIDSRIAIPKEVSRKISQSLIDFYKINNQPTKGKTFEEIYGIDRAEEVRENISQGHTGIIYPKYRNENISKSNMGHVVTEETKGKLRKARLKQIIPKNDTDIEVIMQNALKERGINFETHIALSNICQPDIIIPDRKIVIFCDGNYWHSKDFRNGKVWEKDMKHNEILMKDGWLVYRFWETDIKNDAQKCISSIKELNL